MNAASMQYGSDTGGARVAKVRSRVRVTGSEVGEARRKVKNRYRTFFRKGYGLGRASGRRVCGSESRASA